MSTSIRLARETDAPDMLAIYAPVVRDTPISFELVPPSPDEFAGRIRATLEFAPWLAWEEGGRVVGYAYGGRWRAREAYRWTVEVTVYVHPEAHGRGVGRGLYTALFSCLCLQGFQTATAGVTLPNEGSVRLHESMGFRPIGVFHAVGFKFGRWHDVGWFERALGDHGPAPAETKSVAAASRDPAWEAALAPGATPAVRR